ncbi:MAG: hypothetical protein R3B13_15000 [Polyangiaceae bacterium]
MGHRWIALLALTTTVACSSEQREGDGEPITESAEAMRVLTDARQRARVREPAMWQMLGSPSRALDPSDHPWTRSARGWSSGDDRGSVLVPETARGHVELTSTRGRRLGIRLPAGEGRLQWADGIAVYRGAITSFVRRTDAGIEDSAVVYDAGAGHRLAYDISIPPGARMRTEGASLVLEDAAGNAEFTVSKARVVDANGKEWYAKLSAEACEEHACQVVVSWPESARYPVLIDPTWTLNDGWKVLTYSKSTQDIQRFGHSVVKLDENEVVAIGGGMSSFDVTPPVSDPAGTRFTLAGSSLDGFAIANLNSAGAGHDLRTRFPAVGKVPNGSVVFASGFGNNLGLSTVMDTSYVLAPGTFTPTPLAKGLATPRAATAVGVLGTCVYAIGGIKTNFGLSNAVDRFCTSAWENVSIAPQAAVRAYATATSVTSSLGTELLVIGGNPAKPELLRAGAGAQLLSTVLSWPSSCVKGNCTPWTGSTPLFHHSASELPNGQAFISGGVHCAGSQDEVEFACTTTGAMQSSDRTYIYDGSKLIEGPSLQVGRQQHASAYLANGYVLVIGGQRCTGTSCGPLPADSVAEICRPDPAGSCVKLPLLDGNAAPFDFARVLPSATSMDQGRRVLVAYGLKPGADVTMTPGAMFSLRNLGAVCSNDYECVSDHCVDGVCCESQCDGLCQSCDQAGKCGLSAAGTPDDGCTVEASDCGQDGTCDGAGACAVKLAEDAPCGGTATTCAGNDFINRACHSRACESALTDCMGMACNPTTGCSTTPCDCAPGYFCDGSQCLEKLQSGSCASDEACASGHCVDGVCCDSACDGGCETCGSGTCRPRDVGYDSPVCEAQLCSGSDGACPTSCASATDCKAGFTCNSVGKCVRAGDADASAGSGCGCRTVGRSRLPWGSSLLLLACASLLWRRARGRRGPHAQRRPWRFSNL